MSKYGILICLIIFLLVNTSNVFSQDIINPNLKERLSSNYTNDSNGICDDNELPLDKDCEITRESLLCIEDECILNQTWFIKLLMIVAIALFVLYFQSKNTYYLIVILLILFSIAINDNIRISDYLNTATETNETYVNLYSTNNTEESFDWNQIGRKISPTHPTIGWIAFGVFIYLLFLIFIGILDRVEDNVDKVRRRRI